MEIDWLGWWSHTVHGMVLGFACWGWGWGWGLFLSLAPVNVGTMYRELERESGDLKWRSEEQMLVALAQLRTDACDIATAVWGSTTPENMEECGWAHCMDLEFGWMDQKWIVQEQAFHQHFHGVLHKKRSP